MFPSEVQMKVLREELEREVEQHRLAQLARGENEQPSVWARLRERISPPAPQPQPAVPRKKRVTA